MHVRLPAALLTLVYVAAVAVAVTDLGARAAAGGVVLAGLALRWALRRGARHHPAAVRSAPAAVRDAPKADAVPARLPLPDLAEAPRARTA